MPETSGFMLLFQVLLFACFSRDSLFSIAIGVRFVNHFFDLFFKVLTLLDLVLQALLWCSIILLLSISKCKCFLHILLEMFLPCISLVHHPQPIGFRSPSLLYITRIVLARVDKRSFFAVFYIGNLNR